MGLICFFMDLEKLIPKLTSFFRVGLYFNTRKYMKEAIGEIKEEDEKYFKSLLNSTGGLCEFIRLVCTGGGWITGGPDAAAVTYLLSSYTIDRIADIYTSKLKSILNTHSKQNI